MTTEKKHSFFRPEISFDGVAIFLALIALAVWVGGLKTTVDQHSSELADHEQRLRDQARELFSIERDPQPVLYAPKP